MKAKGQLGHGAAASTGRGCAFDWMLQVVHEVAHAHAGAGAGCFFLPDPAPGDPAWRPNAICAAMPPAAADVLADALAEAGLVVGELLEPLRLFFPHVAGHEHVVVVPLAWQGVTRGVLVVAAATPPLGGAGLGRVAEVATSGLSWITDGEERAAQLRNAQSDAARMAARAGESELLLEVQRTLIASRSTGEVVARLAAWLDAAVLVQMPNQIVAEAAGSDARDLALTADRSAAEKAALTDAALGRGPVVVPASGRHPARLVLEIPDDSGSSAGFLIAALGRRGPETTERAAELARDLIRYQLSVRQDIDRSVVTLRQNLLNDLLSGRFSNDVATQAAKLGHDLKAVHIPLATGPLTGELGDDAVERLVRIVEHASRQASAAPVVPLVGVVSDMVVGLVPEPIPTGVRALAEAVHAEAAQDGFDVVVGIGPPCTRPAELPGQANRACWTVDVLRTTHPDSGASIAHFDDLGVYGLLFDHSRADELAAFAQRWLGPLLDYDRKHRSELVNTLRELFRRKSLADAASALHIHISTLKYRVGRIEEILGVPIESWDNVFNLELAMRIMAVSDHLGGHALRAQGAGRPGGRAGAGAARTPRARAER